MVIDYLHAISFGAIGLGIYCLILGGLQILFLKVADKKFVNPVVYALLVVGLFVTIWIVWMWNA